MKNIKRVARKLKKEAQTVAFKETENLLLNLASGLLPEDLTAYEVKLLENEMGPNWFEALGYDESRHARPSER